MWRIQSLVGRVLSRCHGNTSSLRLSNGPHVEDEVISSSTLLSTNRSQRGEDGEQKKDKRTAEFYSAGLTRYTALDAVGWGAAAVLFMQLCRRIHSRFSAVGEQSQAQCHLPESGLVRKSTHRILLNLLCRHDALPRGVCVMGLQGALTSPEQSDGGGGGGGQPALNTTDQQEETLSHITETLPDFDVPQTDATGCHEPPGRMGLDEAEQNLSEVEANSVPIILNIMGLESAKSGDYEAAFQYFQVSAQQNYSKAQFNVGVCYEKGHGVQKDLNKALLYYRCAAAAGHVQAQYRCAKLLLNAQGERSDSDTHDANATAVPLLQSAAAAGLARAQLYLGVLYSQGPDADGLKSVHYFRQAAERGDSTGLLFLGQCYEKGFGVAQSDQTALSYYKQAAAKGNQRARNTLRDLHSREVLRSIQSAPCLSVLDRHRLSAAFPQVFQGAGPRAKRQPDWPAHALSHSRSAGCLGASSLVYDHAVNAGGKNTGWIIGVG
ncbi:death ligand signal enhancer isoform X2 [Trichomycterus rosablanca]|uniref:death ligand signal enhancer isoform X2 n=1 Tax=Trichomycterus rosablanca TaxID=2290929 RepID=UPI002F35A20B